MKMFRFVLLILPLILFLSGSMPTPRWQLIKAQAAEDISPAPEQSSGSGEETPDVSGDEQVPLRDSLLACIFFVIFVVCLLILCFGGML